MPQFSLVDVSKLTDPAVVLINRFSDAIGWIAAPHQITRKAKAEAAANRIRTESDIEVNGLRIRAEQRGETENIQHQRNLESIVKAALPQVDKNAKPDSIDNDWMYNFLEKCRRVSDSDMQGLWSRILAGEANSPGSYSKRTVNFVSELEKEEANMFSTLCGFCISLTGEKMPLVFDITDQIYASNNLDFSAFSHLDSIGLINFNNLTGFVIEDLPPQMYIVSYFGRLISLNVAGDSTLQMGKVRLTRIGTELERICGAKPVNGFLDYTVRRWSERSARAV